MQIVFSKHAVDQMTVRNINTDDVELILKEPDGIVSQSRDKSVYYKRLKGRLDNLLAVVVVRVGETIEVITVMHNFEVRK